MVAVDEEEVDARSTRRCSTRASVCTSWESAGMTRSTRWRLCANARRASGKASVHAERSDGRVSIERGAHRPRRAGPRKSVPPSSNPISSTTLGRSSCTRSNNQRISSSCWVMPDPRRERVAHRSNERRRRRMRALADRPRRVSVSPRVGESVGGTAHAVSSASWWCRWWCCSEYFVSRWRTSKKRMLAGCGL